MECPIGCEQYTAANPKKECPYCHNNACLKCLKAYITVTSIDPHCMHCRKMWTSDIIDDLFPLSFRKNELRKRTIQQLMDREKVYLPKAIQIAELEDQKEKKKKIETNIKDIIDVIKNNLELLVPIPSDDIQKYTQLISELNTQSEIVRRIQQEANIPIEREQERRVTVRPCVKEGCNGFLSTQWKCSKCSTYVCNKCEEEKKEDHECDPNNVATVIAKRKDSKPCPKCGAYVFRTEGCPQMFCTACTAAFDWNTLKIISHGRIHNPHYFEWQSKQQRSSSVNTAAAAANEEDDPCQQAWTWGNVIEMLPNIKTDDIQKTKFRQIIRLMTEIWDNHVTHEGYQYQPSLYLQYRIQRVRGIIGDKEWATKLSQGETNRMKKYNVHIIDMAMMTACKDIVHLLRNKKINTDEALQQLEELRSIVNQQRLRVYKDTSGKYYKYINDKWEIDEIEKIPHVDVLVSKYMSIYNYNYREYRMTFIRMQSVRVPTLSTIKELKLLITDCDVEEMYLYAENPDYYEKKLKGWMSDTFDKTCYPRLKDDYVITKDTYIKCIMKA